MTEENNNGGQKPWVKDADQRVDELPAGSLREMAAQMAGAALTADDEAERDAYHGMVGSVAEDHGSGLLGLLIDCLVYGGAVFAAAYIWKAPKVSTGWRLAGIIGIGGATLFAHDRIIKRRRRVIHRAV